MTGPAAWLTEDGQLFPRTPNGCRQFVEWAHTHLRRGEMVSAVTVDVFSPARATPPVSPRVVPPSGAGQGVSFNRNRKDDLP